MEQERKGELISYLRGKANIFSRDAHDLTEIDSALAEHRLNITKGAPSIKQKKWHFGPKKDKVIAKEVEKLL